MSHISAGETICGDDPIQGVKFLVNCVQRPSLFGMLMGEKSIIHDRCFTKVTVNKNSRVVRPIAMPDDLRTDGYMTEEILTFDMKPCTEGKSPVRGTTYKSNTSYASGLDTDKEHVHVEGLHFYPTYDSMINDRFGFNGWK